MGYVHYCAYCGVEREADTATILEPHCSNCGCALAACRKEEYPGVAERLADTSSARKRLDSSGALASMTAGPFLLPILGVELSDVVYVIPLIFLCFAAAQCRSAAEREGADRAWLAYAAGAALAAVSCGLIVFADIREDSRNVAFAVGGFAGGCLLIAVTMHLRASLAGLRAHRLLDVTQPLTLVIACGLFFVIEPGFSRGSTILTFVFTCAVVAFAVVGVITTAQRTRRDRKVAQLMWAADLLVVAGVGVLAANAAGSNLPDFLTAVALAGAGWLLGTAAAVNRPTHGVETEAREETGDGTAGESIGLRWLAPRVLVPAAQVMALPLMLALALHTHDGSPAWPLLVFGTSFFLVLTLAFARQAALGLDHRRAVVEERRMRRDFQQRNEELEALTGLATTMTQTLEEAPIVEQALGVLHAAARATSSALHVPNAKGRLKLRAAAGDWQGEHPWADRPVDGIETFERGRRQITRLALRARGHELGVVTFMRKTSDPMAARELELLRLLVDQMAVAVQNAHDYRDKLEQAVRDPLTGLYNRRFIFEALEKEVQRARRYDSHAALVLFDVDDFKRINDTRGHAAGDEVLRGIAAAVEAILRPSDSFARIGGEEFALLLPETSQMDGLLVAERVRAAVSRAEIIDGLRVTMSAGVGSCPHDGPDRETLVKRCDNALYWAKRNGKDMAAVVNETTDSTITGKVTDEDAVMSNLSTLVAAIDAQQLQTRDHSENVALYALCLGREIGLERDHLMRLRRGALLHDIGKFAVRPQVLEKPSKLTDEEFAEIRLHSMVGCSMVHHAGLVEEAHWVRAHHERYDGRGYPDGLSGEDIPLEARIIFIADSFEAMTSDRPYREGMPIADALVELRACAGTQFDPKLVEAFCTAVERGDLEVLALQTPVAEG